MEEKTLIARLAELMDWKVAIVDDDENLFLHGRKSVYSCGTWNPATCWRDFVQLVNHLQEKRGGENLTEIFAMDDTDLAKMQRRVCEKLLEENE